MKKLLLLITTLLSIVVLNAQTSEHLTFQGIPIDGNITEFTEKMNANGFVTVKTIDNGIRMEGRFANMECEVYVLTTPKTKKVYKVVLYAPKDEIWSSLKSNYEKFQNLFTTKYGKPYNHFEFFSDPYIEGDGYETQALNKEKCTYFSLWKQETGNIGLTISTYCQLEFGYEDNINIKLAQKEREDQILDDI